MPSPAISLMTLSSAPSDNDGDNDDCERPIPPGIPASRRPPDAVRSATRLGSAAKSARSALAERLALHVVLANASSDHARIAGFLNTPAPRPRQSRTRLGVATGAGSGRECSTRGAGELAITGSTIHLSVDGADAASAWYCSALGAREQGRITLRGGKLIHVELRFGDLTVMLADEFPDLGSFGPLHLAGTYGAIYLHVDDVDAAWDRALRAGATVVRPLADVFWGERDGQILDPFGHRWGLTQHVRDVSSDEMQRLATAAFDESSAES